MEDEEGGSPHSPDIIVVEARTASLAVLADVEALHRVAFGSADPHDPALAPVFVARYEGDTMVAVASLLWRTIDHAGTKWRAAGLSAVATAPEARRHGHATDIVRTAFAAATERGADFVLFSCDEPLGELYRRASASQLEGSVIVGGTESAPMRSDEFREPRKLVFAHWCTPLARSRAAEFVGVDIVVHPGEIDRLW